MNRLLPSLVVFLIVPEAIGDSTTIGPDGINSKVTGLDGSSTTTPIGIEIGQSEQFRSGKHGYDLPENSAPNTEPHGVYNFGTGGMSAMNSWIDGHATEVAGVMIGKETPNAHYVGVAPKAWLHSMAYADAADDGTIAVTLDRLAEINNSAVKAINMSWGGPSQDQDGRSFLTQFIDWSARRHEVLYVTAWTNFDDLADKVPFDNYNGITVAASRSFQGVYSEWATTNLDLFAVDSERSYIDILAPGDGVDVLTLGGEERTRFGTSFAAPHVTGAVALLHQYKEQRAFGGFERFFGELRHYTTKAILLNSADKLSGVHGSSRDIKNDMGQIWTGTVAYNDPEVPLDHGMGAGHLNVGQAYFQIASGRYESTGGN